MLELNLRDQETIKKSEGGADLIEDELRDVDGDGAPDRVFYYLAKDQWNDPESGWIAAVASGKLVRLPLKTSFPGDRWLRGFGCWALIDRVPVHLVAWFEGVRDRSGESVVKRKASAFTVGARGLEPLRVFAVSVASGPSGDALEERIPAEHRPPELESEVIQPDCSSLPPTVLVVPHRGRWAMLTGFSLSRDSAGRDWPEGLKKPIPKRIVEISNTDPSTWPTGM